MAKQKPKNDKTQNTMGDAPPADNADSAATSESNGAKSGDGLSTTETPKDESRATIEPIAFEVTLKDIHPQDTYGRCGYRFNKTTALTIPRADLTGEQIITLADDPYLLLIPVVEDGA